MNIFVDFIRINYVYSFSFKNFSSNSNSLRKPKPLSLYLASGGRSQDISMRSSIKHEFKLPESQKSSVSNFSIIPSRKDDEFGRPYFKPIVFKYNFYWNNYSRKNIFFIRNFSSTFSYDPALVFFSDVSSGVSSTLNFNFFLKRNFFKKRFKFFRFKKKRKFKTFFRFPYFNFRSNGLFFSYFPISNRFSRKIALFNYKNYLKNFKFNLFDRYNKTNRININTTFNKIYSFKLSDLSKFFLVNKYFKIGYRKRNFELFTSLSSTFSSARLSNKFFKFKFSRFFKSRFKIKRYFFKRKSIFKFFFKFISNINFFKRKLSVLTTFFPSFFKLTSSETFGCNYENKSFNFANFSKKIYGLFFFYKLLRVLSSKSKFYSYIVNYKSIFFMFFKFFFRLRKFKKLKNFFRYFKLYIKFFKVKTVKTSKFFLSAFFFQIFSKFYSKRYNNFSILNIFKSFFGNLLIFNNFFLNNRLNKSHKITFIFSYFYFLFFRGRFSFNKKFEDFSTKFFCPNFFPTINYKFHNFSDFYNSVYSDYNIFSFSRYNDISTFYKSIFNSNFYSYRVSSPRKTGRRSFVSTRKVDTTTFFNI